MDKITLRDIYKSYGAEKVIEGLDLSIREGSFTVLLGPSGCGKSTILRMIAGLEKENAGEIYINGRNMKGVEPGDRDIAMVFQNYALYPTMTVRENMEFGLKNMKVPKPERERRINEITEMIGLGDYMHKKPQFLSGGQRQRVALGRAMVRKPQVFLMDEPLSNLDAKLRSQIRTDLIELHRRLKTTFVYVTHDQVEAMSMGTEVVLLEKGAIRQQASPHDMYAYPENMFTARFIGTPPMNVLPLDSLIAGTELRTAIPPAACHVGFRPERTELMPADGMEAADDLGAASMGNSGLFLDGELGTHEMLGAEVLYKVHAGDEAIHVKQFEDRHIPYGAVRVHVAEGHLFWFDEQGNRIRPTNAVREKGAEKAVEKAWAGVLWRARHCVPT